MNICTSRALLIQWKSPVVKAQLIAPLIAPKAGVTLLGASLYSHVAYNKRNRGESDSLPYSKYINGSGGVGHKG